jgi:hypothetical protein
MRRTVHHLTLLPAFLPFTAAAARGTEPPGRGFPSFMQWEWNLALIFALPAVVLCLAWFTWFLIRERRARMRRTRAEKPPAPAVEEPESGLNLPAGYDFSLTRRRALNTPQRILMLFGFLFAFFVAFIGGPMLLLLVAVFVMPVVIAFYLVFHFIATAGREKPPVVQRRMRVSPKMQKPAQTRHYWTIDDSQYHDKELYDDGRRNGRLSGE